MIPRIIHQIWLGPKTPPSWMMRTWERKHRGWDYMLWTEKNLPELRNREYFDAVSTFNGKSDVLRYELLLNYGGVYCDADSVCVRRLDDALLEHPAFSCYEQETDRPGLIASGFLGSVPDSELLHALVDGLSARPLPTPEHRENAWLDLGPGYFTKTVEALNAPIEVLPSWSFLPRHYAGIVHQGNISPYAIHVWGTTSGPQGMRTRARSLATLSQDYLRWGIRPRLHRGR